MGIHRRLSLRVLLCAALLAGACAVGSGTVASAGTPDDPARGLRYDGMEPAAAGACAGRFELRGNASPGGSPLCTHGPDAAPDGVDVRVPRAPESPSETTLRPRAAIAAEDPPCTGDGSSGPRVQLVYANIAGRPDRSEAFAASFRIWAASTDDVFQRSAAETGGSRRIRFVHDPVTCVPTVAKATLSATGEIDYWTSVEEVYHQGFNRNDRKYLIWVDANYYCGVAAYHDDDRPGQNNDNNNYGGYARVDNGCWGIPGASIEAHELMHVLGGVQDSAPNATGAMHCTDDYDLMCYSDRSGLPLVYRCPYTHENTFDCNHDDYFSTAPPEGTYLATHWNTANSAFLGTPPGAATVPSPPSDLIPVAGENKVILTWTPPHSDGGLPVTGYVVTPYLGEAAQPALTYDSPATTQTLTGLSVATYTFRVAANNSVGTGPRSAASPEVMPSFGGRFNPLPPVRVLDTRNGNGAPIGKLGPNGSLDLQVTGRGGVPASGVSAVVLNVTVTEPTAIGFLTAWPAGEPRPLASNLNFAAGQTVPNLVTVKVGSEGKVSLLNSAGTTHVVADVGGWYGPSGAPAGVLFHPVAPSRLLDTRTGAGAKLLPTGTLDLQVAGRGGTPATGVSAVAVNVTVTEPVGGGFLTTWPTGAQRPLASNLNFAPGQTAANLAVVKVGAAGRISIYNGGGAVHVIVDVAGWFGAEGDDTGARYHPLAPARVLDTRSGNGWIFPVALQGGTWSPIQIAGRGGVPVHGVTAVVLNVIAVDPRAGGFLTVWPDGEARPLASNLNFPPGQTVPNLVVAKLGTNGKISIYNGSLPIGLPGATHLVADVAGWYGS